MNEDLHRDYERFDQFVDELTTDVYAQPPDPGHTEWALETLDWVRTTIYVDRMDEPLDDVKVLDVGCGWGFMCPAFEMWGFEWHGITIGEDVGFAKDRLAQLAPPRDDRVRAADMSFTPYEDGEFDLIYARHVLEHSPFPVVTLMEWHRISKPGAHLCLVAPAPHWWQYGGKNHYSLAPKEMVEFWLKRAGWQPVHYFLFDNRNPSFLKHLEVYMEAIQGAVNEKDIRDKGDPILDRYPPGPVEFRFICRKEPYSVE